MQTSACSIDSTYVVRVRNKKKPWEEKKKHDRIFACRLAKVMQYLVVVVDLGESFVLCVFFFTVQWELISTAITMA